jgi:hypothetical protein
MVSKPQERIPETESCRQYSYLAAAAGVAIPTNASANNAVTGAPDILKSCFILFSPCADFSLCWLQLQNRHGMSGIAAPSSRKNSNGILSGAQEKVENHRGASVLKYDHHSNGSASGGADRV